jgi:hypothetical protein
MYHIPWDVPLTVISGYIWPEILGYIPTYGDWNNVHFQGKWGDPDQKYFSSQPSNKLCIVV